MRIEAVIRLDAIDDKLASKHSVKIFEVEELLANKSKFRFVDKGTQKDEYVYIALGQTDAGRYLTVLFIYKRSKEALILSAGDGE